MKSQVMAASKTSNDARTDLRRRMGRSDIFGSEWQ
jgi:hypothetical protein